MPDTKLTARDVDARKVDAWVAENVFGWTLHRPLASFDAWIDSQGHVARLVHEWSPLTDANADAKVRAAIFQSWEPPERAEFIRNIVQLCNIRLIEGHVGAALEIVLRNYKTGFAAIAAYAVGTGLDVLEVWEEVRRTA